MEIKILTNYDDDLWCVECKQKVRMLEKFGIVYEQLYNGEMIEKIFHLDCISPEDETEDPYISE